MAAKQDPKILEWWSKQSVAVKSDVVAHTPDPLKYHDPDYEEGPGSRMGRGPGGTRGAVIPRARNNGSSRGFDHERVGVVTVDPGDAHGGVVVDLRNLTNEAVQEAIAEVDGNVGFGQDTNNETFVVLAMLGKPASEATAEEMIPSHLVNSTELTAPPRKRKTQPANPYMPGVYVTSPKAAEDERRAAKPRRVIKLAAPVLDEALPEEEDTMPIKPAATRVRESAPDDRLTQLAENMAGMMEEMRAMRRDIAASKRAADEEEIVEELPPSSQPLPPKYSAINKKQKPKAPPEVRAQEDLYESMELGFLTPKPSPPKRLVVIDLGPGGITKQRFHEIVESDSSVVLVYDTRYEGSQWLPPSPVQTGQDVSPVTMQLLFPAEHGEPKRLIKVSSLGLTYSLGCLDFIVLLREDEQPADIMRDGMLPDGSAAAFDRRSEGSLLD